MNVCKSSTGRAGAIAATIAAALAFSTPAFPATSGFDGCIQDVWKAHNNSQNLTCTAGDVRIAKVTNITVTGGGSGTCTDTSGTCECTQAADPANPPNCGVNPSAPGCVTFVADFNVLLNAQTRYDIGLYISTDGGGTDGALTGSCFDSIITSGNAQNFDNADGDICGDIENTAAKNPQIVHLTVTTACVGDANGKLKLPNCTSWRQPGSNTVCGDFHDSYPGSPSKCNCQPGFTVNINVVKADITVDKSVSPGSVPETGGTVTYTVKVTNPSSSTGDLIIDTINDDQYGDLADSNLVNTEDALKNASPVSNTCPNLVGTHVAPGANVSCTFNALVDGSFVSGGSNSFTDVATVCGHDNGSNPGTGSLCGHDDATVDITDVATAPSIAKTAQSAVVTADVTYQVVINNNSLDDTLTVNTVTDDRFGDITTVHAAGGGFEEVVTKCTLSQNPIPAGGNASCTFVGRHVITTTGNTQYTNTASATTTDQDGHNCPDSGAGAVCTSLSSNQATVSITVSLP